MNIIKTTPVNRESSFEKSEIIVSKTDIKGRITYANDIFCRVAEISTRDVMGKPHNIIRHPDMPRTIFKYLWDNIMAKEEVFAYVKNMTMTGKYYWVFAHVTPSLDNNGNITGYHSNRRKPAAKAVKAIEPLYREILATEQKQGSPKEALKAGLALLQKTLKERNQSYDEFIWQIGEGHV